jgi:hypothetical protein
MSVAIDHLDCHYAVRGKGGAAMRARLDRIAATDLVNALQRRVEPLPEDDGAFCFIECLEIDTAIGSDVNEYDVAERWAKSFWQALAKRLRDRDGAVRFASRAELIAAFVVELLTGDAGTHWYFAELDAEAGSIEDRLSRALLADPDAGREALAEIHRRGYLYRLIDLLGEAHLEELVTRCLTPASGEVVFGVALQRWTAAVRALLASARFVPSGRDAEDAIVLYFEMLAARPDLGPDVNLARWIVRLLGVAALCARTPALAAAIRDGDYTAARPILESPEQARFAGSMLQAVPPREVAALTGDIRPTSLHLTHTSHAGVFLLARSVLALDLEEPLSPEELFLAIVEILGGTKAAREDAGVAVFAGLERRMAEDAPPSATRPLPPIAAALLADFAGRLGAFADSSAEYLLKNFLRGRGVVRVTKERIHVRFIDCPMRIVLRMTGLDAPIAMPWNRERLLELDLE